MTKDRFSKILGEDYNLINKVLPHYNGMRDEVGSIIKNFCASLQLGTIKVIDGGSGTGLATIRILEADPHIEVIGIENEEKTLKQARIILQDYEKRVDLRKEDLLDGLKSIADNSVDIFASVLVIHNLVTGYRKQLFSEITRILKSGGLFINADKLGRNEQALQKKEFDERIKAFNIFAEFGRIDLKNEWTKHYQQDEIIKITEAEQTNILHELGFKDIDVPYRKEMEAIVTAIK